MNTFINNQRLANLAGVNYDSEQVQSGPIVYTRTHLVHTQFPHIRKLGPVVLITSFSDAKCERKMVKNLPGNVIKWYTNNLWTMDSKVEAVPLGLRTSPEGEKILRLVMARSDLEKKGLVYMNFYRRIPRNPNPRRGLYEQFGERKWITVEGGFDHVPMDHFYAQIKAHHYVLSPPGAGPDCHRHWEAILLGSIPIVLRSPATAILDDLPCLQIDKWDLLTEKRLRNQLPKLRERFQWDSMKKIWFEYWRDKILETAL